MNKTANRFYEFGPFRLDAMKRLLLRDGELVTITPKAFDVLLALVQSNGQVLEKDDLMRQLWPDTVVEEHNLTVNISGLRKTLGEAPNKHEYIVTIPGRGYRFVASVREVRDEGTDRILEQHGEEMRAGLAPSPSPRRGLSRKVLAISALLLVLVSALSYVWISGRAKPASPVIRSIAVLPFKPLVAGSRNEALEMGMADTLITKLSNLRQLTVRPISAVRKYTSLEQDPVAAGREQKVDTVLESSLQWSGEKIRVSVRLISVQDGAQLWADKCDEQCSADIFTMQDSIAEKIAGALALKLTGEERERLTKRYTENLKAFQYYMQGRAYTNRPTRENMLAAIRYYERAIEEDRNYALAYSGLAGAYGVLGAGGHIAPLEGRRQAEEAARKALALDDNLAEAHVALGLVYTLFVPYNFSLGERELRRAIELSPSLARTHQYLGGSLARQGRLDESLEEYMKARELDPLSSIIARQVALPYYLKRDYGRALELLRQANELNPPFTAVWEIGAYIHNRLFDEALAELEKAKRERKDDPVLISSTAMVYAAQGKRAEALQIIKELEVMSGASLDQAHWIAKIYAALNEKELALTWLERGLAAGAIGAFYKDDPVWDAIRRDPRFADLLRRMGIPPQ